LTPPPSPEARVIAAAAQLDAFLHAFRDDPSLRDTWVDSVVRIVLAHPAYVDLRHALRELGR